MNILLSCVSFRGLIISFINETIYNNDTCAKINKANSILEVINHTYPYKAVAPFMRLRYHRVMLAVY